MSSRLDVAGITANIVPIQGSTMEAVFFLRPTGTQGRATETLGDRLAEPGARFITVEIAEQIQFVNLGSIAYVEAFGELTEMARFAELGAWREPVEITLINGKALTGDLVYLLPPERRRVSDLLNEDGRFVLLVGETHVRYVNREAIERVRPLGDDET